MKKILFLLVSIFMTLFAINNSVNVVGSVIPADTTNQTAAYLASKNDPRCFNAIFGMKTSDEVYNSKFHDVVGNTLTYLITDGYLYISQRIASTNVERPHDLELCIRAEYHGADLIQLIVRLYDHDTQEDTVIMDYTEVTGELITNEIDLGLKYNTKDKFVITGDIDIDTSEAIFKTGFTELNDYAKGLIDINCVYVMEYKFNEELSDGPSNVDLVFDYDLQPTEEEILNYLTIYNQTGETKELTIDNSDYVSGGDIGSYSMRVIAVDTNGNTTVQNVNIDIYDVTGPTVRLKSPARIQYHKVITSEQILNLVEITDNYGVDLSTLNLNMDAYLENTRAVGIHNLILTVSDVNQNQTEFIIPLEVYDNIAPVITIPKHFISTTLHKLTLDEIKEQITAVDEIDGNITFTLTDIDGYENSNELKTYSFSVTASDSKGNSLIHQFSLPYIDNDYPTIDFIPLIIAFGDDRRYNKDELISLIEQTRDFGSEIVDVESQYFEEGPLQNEYELTITLENGDKINNRIKLIKRNNLSGIDNNVVDEFNINPFIIVGGVSFITILIIVIGIVKFKKKH